MTDDDLGIMARLWASRVSTKKIAYTLGYNESYILHVAMENRDMFPYRRGRVDKEEMDGWVTRIIAGEASVRQAAESMSVHEETVRKRLRNAKARMADEDGQHEA